MAQRSLVGLGMISLQKRCPNCDTKLSYFRIKKQFDCNKCEVCLKSNLVFSVAIPLIAGSFLAPRIGPLIFSNFIINHIFQAVFIIAFFVVFWPMLLEVKINEEK